MNSAFNRSTGYTSAYLTFGREMRTLSEITHYLVQSENFVQEITPQLENLARILSKAKENIEVTQDSNRTRANYNRRTDPGYEIGDLLLERLTR